jgi:2-C-methyl-D-erythritol 4-phosphate cytidylyltransferase
MNFAIILTGGVGQRLRSSGMPKQFIELYGKPIVAYTLEKFELCSEIDFIVVVCHASWMDKMSDIINKYGFKKVSAIVAGGKERHNSVQVGLQEVNQLSNENDIVMIHDGVRPLIKESTILENIRIANEYGNAMTVRSVVESVVVTKSDTANIDDFQNRDDTFTLTSPQTFRVDELKDAYVEIKKITNEPILDSSLVYARLGKKIYLVREQGLNLKITTPEDFYYFRSILELEERKAIFGL